MKTKLYIVIMIVGCLCFTVNAQQTQKTPEDKAKALTEEMKSKLSLNDSQYQKVYDINPKYAKQDEALMKSTADHQSKMESMEKQMEVKKQEMKGILTADQYKKYEGMCEKYDGCNVGQETGPEEIKRKNIG